MSIYLPYTYLIGWTALDKWYYGVRHAQGCHPSDFWEKYFTSSTYVTEIRQLYGDPDIIQIRKTFANAVSAMHWERNVLTRLNVAESARWINQSCGYWPLRVITEETRRKMSAAAASNMSTENRQKITDGAKTRKPVSLAARAKMSASAKKRKRDPHSEETRQKIAKANIGKKMSVVARSRMSDAETGKSLSKEHCAKISQSVTTWWEDREQK
jgi:hypothetical protein